MPSIELYLDGRYFTITELHPSYILRLICARFAVDNLLWLIQEAGPAFAAADKVPVSKRSGDSSRSAVAFRKGAALRRSGATFDQMAEALRADPRNRRMVPRKGRRQRWAGSCNASGTRRSHHVWLARCQYDSKGNLTV